MLFCEMIEENSLLLLIITIPDTNIQILQVTLFCWRLCSSQATDRCCWYNLIPDYDIHKTHTHETVQYKHAEFLPLLKWTNQPPDQFSVVEAKCMKGGGGLGVQSHSCFFLIDVIQQPKFPSICLSWSNMQPTMVCYDDFAEVMRPLRWRECIFVHLNAVCIVKVIYFLFLIPSL